MNEKLITDKIQELMDEQEDTRIYAGLGKALEVIWQMSYPLNDDQKIVLGRLKETSEKYAIKMNPIASIYTLHSNYATNDTADIFDAYEELSDVEEAEVIQAFSAWVLEKEEDAE